MPGSDRVTEEQITGFVMDSTRERYQRLSWQGSFREYLARVSEDPYRHTRTSYQLLRDMILSYGFEHYEDNGEDITHYKLFDDPFEKGKNRIYGLDRTIEKLFSFIDGAARERGKERILLLHGPVGTAKTSIVDMLARGMEAYTSTAEGEVYSFAWRFGKDFLYESGGSGVGFSPRESGDVAGVNNPIAVLPSQLCEHPLLLIPREERRDLLTKLYRQAGIYDSAAIPHKLLEAELEYNSKQIYNFLIRKYEGNWLKVMDHVLVQRIQFSESAGIGVAKIPPEGNVETASQPVTMDENFRYIANLISSISLVRYYGKYVHGNRGLVHYSDIFKKPAHALQHLLSAVEEHRMDFGETGCTIDVALVATTNIMEYLNLRNDPMSQALRSRIRKIDVPYLRNWRDEERIYKRGLRPFKRSMAISPHTTSLAARWAVMTRLEPTELHESEEFDKETRDVLRKITALRKSAIYAGLFPRDFSNRERNRLNQRVRRRLVNEHKYEAMHGVATRTLQDLFSDLCLSKEESIITPFKVFELLEGIVRAGAENYDFLAREEKDGWYDFDGFILQLREEYDEILRDEIENSIVDVDDKDMENRIREYLRHISAFNRSETLRHPATGREVQPEESLMRSIEGAMDVDDAERKNFRFKLLNRASAVASEGKKIDIHELYADVFASLHRTLFEQKREAVKWQDIEQALAQSPDRAAFEKFTASKDYDKYRDAQTLLRNMEFMYGYVYPCAREAILYYIRSLLNDEL